MMKVMGVGGRIEMKGLTPFAACMKTNKHQNDLHAWMYI